MEAVRGKEEIRVRETTDDGKNVIIGETKFGKVGVADLMKDESSVL